VPVWELVCPDCGHTFRSLVMEGARVPAVWVCSACGSRRAGPASVEATELTITPIDPSPGTGGSHATTPGALLAFAGEIYQRRPERALQVAIPASDFRFGERLSPETSRWAERAVASIAALLMGEECLLGQD